jgi:hypothetical protein
MENFKIGLSVFGKYIICLLLCFFTVVSFSAIFSIIYPPEAIGEYMVVYKAAEKDEDIKIEHEYAHMYKDGEDTKKAEYEAQGYKVESARKITGAMSGMPAILAHFISQTISLGFFIVIVPYELYRHGQTDRNKVQCGRMAEDKLRGIKAALPVAAVEFASWEGLVLAKLGVFRVGFSFYRFTNYHMFGLQQLVIGNPEDYTTIPVWSIVLALFPVLLTIFVCWLNYTLGYKDINLYEKLVYKKK